MSKMWVITTLSYLTFLIEYGKLLPNNLTGDLFAARTHPERWRDRPCETSATWVGDEFPSKVPTPADSRVWKMRYDVPSAAPLFREAFLVLKKTWTSAIPWT
jgi:hypothetical protein